MVTARKEGYRTGLVNMTAGQISREIFVNDEIYQQELERLFARVWLFVGHESQIPKPGDYFVSGMGEESVLLCRDRANKVHVFLNSCRHRGMTKGTRRSLLVLIMDGAMAPMVSSLAFPISARLITNNSTNRNGD